MMSAGRTRPRLKRAITAAVSTRGTLTPASQL